MKRFVVVALVLLLLFSLLIFRFYQLQILEHERWKKLGERQHFFTLEEPFRRGRFFAKTGEPLVYDIKHVHLHIDPKAIPERARQPLLSALFTHENFPEEKRAWLSAELEKKSRSRRLIAWLPLERKAKTLAWWKPFAKEHKIAKNALFFVSDYKRSYPNGHLLGQVLHTILHNKDEKTKQGIPTGGLELYFQSYLKGEPGKRMWMRSPLNRFETGQILKQPKHGTDIHLTIDPVLQTIVEEELETGVKEAEAKRGLAVMMDPETGKLLALAQYPFFSPSDYPTYFKERIEDTRIHSVQDAQEPGSAFKAIVVTLALVANEYLDPPLFDPEEKIACKQGQFPGRKKPVTDTRLHPFLNLNMAIQKSSNIYMAHLMQRMRERLGEEWIRKQLIELFGFGQLTGIELPAETPGLVPRPGVVHPNGALEWSLATPYSLAMGHNILVNSIQMTRAFAVLANGGYLVKPTLLEKIERQQEGRKEVFVDYRERKKEDFPKVLPTEITQRVVEALKYSTKLGGTARKADVFGYTEAGKSSTAKKVKKGRYQDKEYIPSFIGFTPVKAPKLVLLITLDEPLYGPKEGRGLNHHGGACCAPIFGKIARRALVHLGVEEDDPYGYPYGDPRRDRKKADWMEEVEALKERYEAWNEVKKDL